MSYARSIKIDQTKNFAPDIKFKMTGKSAQKMVKWVYETTGSMI
jgi:hypothetical protein